MKNLKSLILFGSMAIAAIACTREAAPETAQEGTFVTTSFSVALPVEDMDTKAVALEKELLFVVFDNEGKVIEDMMQTVPVENNKATIQASLLAGQSYTLAFWAQKPGAYVVNLQGAISIPYSSMASNDFYDAFFATYKLDDVQNGLQGSITLKRPFAQVNVGVSYADSLFAASNGVIVKDLQPSYQFSAPGSINLIDGTPGEIIPMTIALPVPGPWDRFIDERDDDGQPVPDKCFTRAGTFFVLAGESFTQLDKFQLSLKGKQKDKDITITKEITNVPVKPNQQTNILGALFEGNIEPLPTYTVTIDKPRNGYVYLYGTLDLVGEFKEGDTVRIEYRAEDLYYLAYLEYSVAGSSRRYDIDYKDEQDGAASFTMPAGDVTVESYFTQKGAD